MGWPPGADGESPTGKGSDRNTVIFERESL
jgi:hypothetical protein